jgi:hypothetical protein
MNDSTDGSGGWASKTKKNTVHLGYWTVAWLATTAVAAFGPKLVWNFATLPTVLGVLINIVVGFGMILATRRHLLGLDEMQQKIFLDAGALTLGVGLVCGLSYELLEDIKLITFEPEISHLAILMCLTFMVGMVVGHRKYR